MRYGVTRFKSAIFPLCVALFAALIGHVVIDVLGDFMLAHDAFDDLDHSSRAIVAVATLGLGLIAAGGGLRAMIREARGSDNAFCLALRSLLPRNVAAFLSVAAGLSILVLVLMEGGDSWLAGRSIDDVGDLLGGSILFGLTIQSIVAIVCGLFALDGLRRLSRLRVIVAVLGAFLRRRMCSATVRDAGRRVRRRRVFRVRAICRRIAGRAPPLLILVATR